MNKRVLLVANDEILGKEATAFFSQDDEFELVGIATDGEKAPDMIRETRPHFIFVQWPMDGAPLKPGSWKQGEVPRVALIADYGKQGMESYANELGCLMVFLRPVKIPALCRWMRAVLPNRDAGAHLPGRSNGQVEAEIVRLLRQMAIPPHIKGYRYLQEAIYIVVMDVGMLQHITNGIYQPIAQRFDTEPSRVERNMRHAIEVAWNRCRVETIEKVFGYTVNMDRDKPSNGEFIAMIADRVRLRAASSDTPSIIS